MLVYSEGPATEYHRNKPPARLIKKKEPQLYCLLENRNTKKPPGITGRFIIKTFKSNWP